MLGEYGLEWIISLCKGVDNMREVMEYELETKKKYLLKLQDYFRTDIKDINSPKYEDNAINALLEIKKIKTEIEQVEHFLQLK